MVIVTEVTSEEEIKLVIIQGQIQNEIRALNTARTRISNAQRDLQDGLQAKEKALERLEKLRDAQDLIETAIATLGFKKDNPNVRVLDRVGGKLHLVV